MINALDYWKYRNTCSDSVRIHEENLSPGIGHDIDYTIKLINKIYLVPLILLSKDNIYQIIILYILFIYFNARFINIKYIDSYISASQTF